MQAKTVYLSAISVAMLVAAALFLLRKPSPERTDISNTPIEAQRVQKTDRADTPSRRQASSTPSFATSKAPWRTFDSAYKAGNYAWLVANARSSPQSGSYSYAIKALASCMEIMARGPDDK